MAEVDRVTEEESPKVPLPCPMLNGHRNLNGSYLLACGISDDKETMRDFQEPVVDMVEPVSPLIAHLYENPNMEDISLDSDEENVKDSSLPAPEDMDDVSPRCNVAAGDRSLPSPSMEASHLGHPLCRICHEDDTEEELLSPCFCSGSMGMLHLSCLEKWLGTSDTTKCEICQYQFTVTKRPRSTKWYLTNKKLRGERQYMMADFLCGIIFAPCTIGTTLACLIGANYFTERGRTWEAIGLTLLSCANLCVFFLWCGFCSKRNIALWDKWKKNHQVLKIKYNPPTKTGVTGMDVAEPEIVIETGDNDESRKGTPWPTRKQKRHSRNNSVNRKLVMTPPPSPKSSEEIDSSTPVHSLRQKLMRRWGLHGHEATPIYSIPAHDYRGRRGYESHGMVCFTPVPSPEEKYPISAAPTETIVVHSNSKGSLISLAGSRSLDCDTISRV